MLTLDTTLLTLSLLHWPVTISGHIDGHRGALHTGLAELHQANHT